MGETKNRIDQIVDDFKGSWYFRFWALIWLICFIMFWVTLGVFGAKSTLAKEEPAWRIWIENDTKEGLEYPSFYFRVQYHDQGEQFLSTACSLNGTFLTRMPCPALPDTSKCVAYKTSAGRITHHNRGIRCNLITNANKTVDRLILFGIETGHNDTRFGDKWDLFVGPNAAAHIMLQRDAVKHENGKGIDFWSKRLVYHSSIFTDNNYTVDIEFQSFDTMHYQQYDYYNGWMAVSDVGGFAFFMSILLAIVMLIVGCIFENDSRFLNNGSKYSQNI